MSGHELGLDFGSCVIEPGEQRAAALYVAFRVADEHPHSDGRRVAHDPTSRADVLELLAAIGHLDIQQGAAMGTTTAPSTAEIATAIDTAADVIEVNGLHKGYLYDEKQAATGLALERCHVDAVGAVNIAVFDAPRWPAEEHAGSPLAQAAVLALEATVGKPVPGWNDENERTADDVVTAMRDTAARLREAK